MATKPSPFAGVRLSDQTPVSPTRPDQRLFSPTVPVPSPQNDHQVSRDETVLESRERGKLGKRETGKEAKKEAKKEGKREGNFPPKTDALPAFSLDEKPYRKDSFLFTSEEFEALEDLKLELRRQFDLRATKNDIARCALHHLVEDYRHKGPDSAVIRRLSAKKR